MNIQTMKTLCLHRATVALVALLAQVCMPTGAQEATPFKSGSTGELGDVEITTNTNIVLPPDGLLHYKSFTVAPNVTVTFQRNAANTPVYLLATGPVAIKGVIEISGDAGQRFAQGGLGGPGGFDGGNTTPALQAGRGPGAAKVGSRHPSSHGTVGGSGAGPVYGDPLLLTLVGGSGGAAGTFDGANRGGGGGGGAILIASDVSVSVTGNVYARGRRGGEGDVNAGSGGAIRVIAPEVTGLGRLWADAHDLTTGYGRVRVDSLNRAGFSFDVRAVYAAGANMIARLPNPPALRIVHAAGTDIAPTALGVVRVILPNGAAAVQPIRIQATGFKSQVPIRITLYPESGNPIEIDETIDNSTGDATLKEIPATFPINTPTRVMVWTRPAI